MIFDKTMQTMRDFDSVIQTANETFLTAKKMVVATYKEPAATEKLREASDKLVEVKTRETKSACDAVKADFAAVREKMHLVKAVVGGKVSGRFLMVQELGYQRLGHRDLQRFIAL